MAPTPTPTHCPYCALQCAMGLLPDPGPVPVRVEGRDFPTNRGGLCRKGWTSADLLTHPDRLTAPLLRGPDGTFAEVSWDQAYDTWTAAIRTAQQTYGPDAVGVFGGASLTNEKAYLLGKFTRLALRSSRIDYNGRFCMASAATAGNRSFGIDRGLPFPVADLDAAHTVLLVGSNVADTMPPFVQHLAGARAAGRLVVVDPRRTATADLTDDGQGLHLQPRPGTDLALLLGLAHVVLNEGLADSSYVATRTSGAEDLRRSLATWWPERVEGLTGVPAGLIRDVAVMLAERPRGTYILTGRGVEQHVDGTDTATAAINLALLLGLPGGPDSGYGTLTGQGNGQGAREHGQKADQLPGYRSISSDRDRAAVAAAWGVDPSVIPGPGLPAVALLRSLGRPEGVHCLWVNGANIAVSAPAAAAVEEGLDRLDFLVVSDIFFSETAAHADLVLPTTQWAEEEGTMTNLEGRVLRRRRALTPPAGVRSDLQVMAAMARRLDAPGSFPEDPAEVFEELRRASAGGRADYSGITYAAIEAGEAAYWPWPAGGTPTPRLFTDRFAHPDGRARLVAVAPHPHRHHGEHGPVVLTTGRLLEHYQSGNQTRRVASLAQAAPEPRMEIHPRTAEQYGLPDGGMVRLTSDWGSATARTTLTEAIRPGCVFVPFHYAHQGAVNRVVGDRTDPLSGMPEFKGTPVTLTSLPEETP
ncbi:assimilatory nitrate reductase (NADH) alpha subunit apoprotein [Raineyella antarctica]|uniref:Assimilatory nitrate reductase (NADH) alpha subunit apoprotein n=1 Tax=Raineyella antarctica TaxID=1577474 RepID=A0A1G6GG17_9ACTN|nr:molybdopterin oxidoreductase family protein [Raineyella antarctica]SDB80839.1 assimilatory nitrate reductase (NADH) alpha subunit apoprotein [Raineyella antarctica]